MSLPHVLFLTVYAGWRHSQVHPAPRASVSLWWANIQWSNGKEREVERFMCCGKRQNERHKGSEEQADRGGILSTLNQGNNQSWAAAKDHVWVHGCPATRVHYSYCYQSPQGYQGLGHHLESYWCSGTMLPLETWLSKWLTLSFWGTWWHPGPRCCWGRCLGLWPYSRVDVHGSCYHQGLLGCQGSGLPLRAMLVSEGHADLDDMWCHLGPW